MALNLINRKNLLCFIFATLSIASQAHARQCVDLFFGHYRLAKPTADELAVLSRDYPQYLQKVAAAKNSILNSDFNMSRITSVEQIEQRTEIRGQGHPRNLAQSDNQTLKKSVVVVFNELTNKTKMAEYVEALMIEAGVYMLRNKNSRTREIQDPNNGASNYAAKTYTTKSQFLERGLIDRHSLLYVLVNRLRSRGENFAYIHNKGFTDNGTRTQRYSSFFEVPGRGPFIDDYFSAGSGHGRDVHLIQMDYVAGALARATQNKPRIFWDYTTNDKAPENLRGTWVWDSFFDSFNGTFMEPEYLGRVLRESQLPVH